MVRQENSNSTPATASEPKLGVNGKKGHRNLYSLFAGLAIIIAIVATLLVPPDSVDQTKVISYKQYIDN